MLFPYSRSWTPGQRWLLIGAALAGLIVFAGLVYSYERYYRGPDDKIFVGVWSGKDDATGDDTISFDFKADHTFAGGWLEGSGQWQGAGEFLYLLERWDGPWFSVPYDTLEMWHIDSMTSNELRMHSITWGLHATLRRVE